MQFIETGEMLAYLDSIPDDGSALVTREFCLARNYSQSDAAYVNMSRAEFIWAHSSI